MIIVTFCNLERIFSIILRYCVAFTCSSCYSSKGYWTNAMRMNWSFWAVCSHFVNLMSIGLNVVHNLCLGLYMVDNRYLACWSLMCIIRVVWKVLLQKDCKRIYSWRMCNVLFKGTCMMPNLNMIVRKKIVSV